VAAVQIYSLYSVVLGGVTVTVLPLDPRFAGSNPAEEDTF
jgi:hypothetical protein